MVWYPVSDVIPCPTCNAPLNGYDETDYEIGKPRGGFIKINDTSLSREFENVKVTINLETETADIVWSL
jgi:hypothetical protein